MYKSIQSQLESARTVSDINLVRERIKLEIDVPEARRGYYKSCDILENIIVGSSWEDDSADYDARMDMELAMKQARIDWNLHQGEPGMYSWSGERRNEWLRKRAQEIVNGVAQ